MKCCNTSRIEEKWKGRITDVGSVGVLVRGFSPTKLTVGVSVSPFLRPRENWIWKEPPSSASQNSEHRKAKELRSRTSPVPKVRGHWIRKAKRERKGALSFKFLVF